VVTVLFCDLVGFTSRAEQMDPEDVRALLAPYHEHVRGELERYGGTVEKFIGDAVMAVFGAPVAHEDDPERAVRAGLAIRDWAQEEGIELRIGVNSGEALVTIGGEPLATGDVVNTAARLQTAAPTGGILIGETTYRATRDRITYDEHPAVQAKGKTDPVPVWVALQSTARVTVEREARAPLVGRKREVRVLADALERARAEKTPQLVTLVGAPGIGKSRLVYELFKALERGSEFVYWRRGRSLPYGEGVAFWALSEIVKAQAGILETDAPEQAEAKLRDTVRAAAGEEDPAWLERHLAPLVGLEGEGEGDSRIEAFAAWRAFFEALAEQRPLVLVFEDLHWADDALLDFIDHLVDWSTGVALLVVATARPELLERRVGWGGGKPNSVILSLPPLSETETARLVHSLLESPVLPADTQAALLARAGGNPLYAEEFARLVAEGRAPDELPATIQGLIAARIDLLPAEEKALLQAASVVGRTFWLGAVAAISNAPRWTVQAQLHALERKEFMRRERRSAVAGETEYAFGHVLIRDTAYGQIPRGDRADRHRRAAEWIESLGRPDDHAELLAYHYLSALELDRAAGRAAPAAVERARAATRAAGDRALSLNAFRAAASFFDQTRVLTAADDASRPELLLRLGSAFHRVNDRRAEQTLEEAAQALVATGERDLAAEAHTVLSELWWDRGQRDRSSEHVERAVDLVSTGPTEARARVLARRARAAMLAGRDDEALASAREGLAIAEALGLDETSIHLLNTSGTARFQLGDPEGIKDLERSVELALARGSHLVGNNYNNLAVVHHELGDIRRDRELRDQALPLAERFGDERMLRFIRLCIPLLDFYAGNWECARAGVEAAVAEFEAGFAHYLEPNVRATQALLRLAEGEPEAALESARRAEELAREAKDPQMVNLALSARLHVLSQLGEVDAGAKLSAELLARHPGHHTCPPAISLAWAAERLGNHQAVRDWVERIPYPSLWTEAALNILDGALDRAADLFVRIGSLPDEAYARLCAGDPKSLERALAFYRAVGATSYVREAEEALATGSRAAPARARSTRRAP
jgi:class 3 adenylate cyclase/tetratricopeptide (TPR) repeat protein